MSTQTYQPKSEIEIARIDLRDSRETIVKEVWEFRTLLANIISTIDAAGNDPQKLSAFLEHGCIYGHISSQGRFSYDLCPAQQAGELMGQASAVLQDARQLEGALTPWVNCWGSKIRPTCPSCHGTDFVDGMCCVACQVQTAENEDAAESDSQRESREDAEESYANERYAAKHYPDIIVCPMCHGCEIPYGVCGACGGSGVIDPCGP